MGLTLLELVVVLGILAVLAGVAVQSLEPLGDQARIETTQQTLDAFQKAIYREDRDGNDRLIIRGFVADIGRPPIAVGSNPATYAEELWDGTAFKAYGFQDFHDTLFKDINGNLISAASLNYTAGWNGPYLEQKIFNQATTTSGIFDGWGNPLRYYSSRQDQSNSTLVQPEHPLSFADAMRPNSSLIIQAQEPFRDTTISRSLAVELKETNSEGSIIPLSLESEQSCHAILYGTVNGAITRIFPTDDSADDNPTKKTTITVPNVAIGPKVLVGIVCTGTWPNITTVRMNYRHVNILHNTDNNLQLIVPK